MNHPYVGVKLFLIDCLQLGSETLKMEHIRQG